MLELFVISIEKRVSFNNSGQGVKSLFWFEPFINSKENGINIFEREGEPVLLKRYQMGEKSFQKFYKNQKRMDRKMVMIE